MAISPVTPHFETVADVPLKKLVLGGMLAMLFSCLIVSLVLPFMLVLIVPVAIVLMFFMAFSLASGEMASRKAQILANRHLSSMGKTKLQVIEQVGDGSALVLNDWGAVFCTMGKKPVELSWSEILAVGEPTSKVLVVQGYNKSKFTLDLAVAKRFFLVTASMLQKIPERCNFDIDPLTGESCLLKKLDTETREWKGSWGSFAISADGIQFKQEKIFFDVLQEVRESMADADPDPGMLGKIYTLHFKSPTGSFSVSSEQLEGDYNLVKRIIAEKCPQKCSMATDAESPRDIAYDEFCLLKEVLGSLKPLNTRKAAYLERYYVYMFALVQRFKFKLYPEVRRFLEDYAELLRFLGKDSEAKEIDEFNPG